MPLIDISTARVIEEVKLHPILWKTTDPNYRSKNKRHEAWQAILHKLVPNFGDMPIPQQRDTDKAIQQRWKTARDAYMRNKALIKSGAIVKKYFYYELLSFLDDIGPGWYESRVSAEGVTSSKVKHVRVQVEPLSPSSSSYTSTTSPAPAILPTSPPPLAPLSTTNTLSSETQIIVKMEPTDEIDNNDDYNYNENSHDASQLHTEIDIDDEMNNEMKEEIPVEFVAAGYSKPRKTIKRTLVGGEINVEIYKMLKKTTKDLKDDNMSFFMSMLPIVNKFSDRRKLQFRSEVIRIALELSSQDD